MSEKSDHNAWDTSFQSLPIRERWTLMARALVETLDDYTMNVPFAFSGTFAKLDYTLNNLRIRDLTLRKDLNALRDFNRHGRRYDEKELEERFTSVYSALSALQERIQHPEAEEKETWSPIPDPRSLQKQTDKMRVLVRKTEGENLICSLDNDYGTEIIVPLRPKEDVDFTYLLPYVEECLRQGAPCQLNLIQPRLENKLNLSATEISSDNLTPRATYVCELIVFQPDYLIDITAVSRCFKPYGTSPLNWLISLFEDVTPTQATLLGNFAGQMLDEEIYHRDAPLSYAESVMRFFRKNAIAIATCTDFDSATFHVEGKRQQQHLRQLAKGTLPKGALDFDFEKVVLEPSFICEALGIQGRMDLLQDDMKILIEQKSGKKDEFRNRHKEEHYVQTILYLALLHYGFGLRNDEVSPFLLYSKYDPAEGLLREGSSPTLLREAMAMRNGIAHLALTIGQGEGEKILTQLKSEDLRLNPNCPDKFWIPYILPRIEEVLSPIKNADEISRRYFFRFLTFVQKEQTLAKLGNGKKQNSGFAATWNDSIEEKTAAGNIISNLSLKEAEETEDEGISKLTFKVSDLPDQYAVPNFRQGDYVMLYSYKDGDTPDARQSIVFRANITTLRTDEISVQLLFPQKNKRLFKQPELRFAIEHDHRDGIGTSMFRSMHRILDTERSRRELLLCQREPRAGSGGKIHATYGDEELNDIVRKAMTTEDFFLLVGPPGTGKTSKGLLSMTQEVLATNGSSVLLMAYTNRAVDEICSKLSQARIDFLRLGNRLTCASEYHKNLLEERLEQCKNADEIKSMIRHSRVVVATTSTMMSNMTVFNLRTFSVAIIDEASQILEPQLMGLLCARGTEGLGIEKFILIGDHKQLPAVVQQSEKESEVQDPTLRAIGVTNCRQSLFQRLYNLYAETRPDLVATLTRQARMHEEVAEFSARTFYGDNLKTRFPRQSMPMSGPSWAREEGEPLPGECEEMGGLRFAFVNVPAKKGITLMDKVNMREAQFIASLINNLPKELTVGVIVPYRHQIAAIHRALAEKRNGGRENVMIDTVERFQGSERDVIVFGATVQRERQLRFLLSDTFEEGGHTIDRRLNVALTRARERLYVVGNAELLGKLPIYAALIDYAKKGHAYVEVKG